jgi:5-amino-6-(5-phosphoribosylamino)uracil reductase
MVSVRPLLPADADPAEVLDGYATPPPGRRGWWLRANMVASADGAATGPDGRSGPLSSPADRQVFHHLRGLADAVLVGAGTARAENYGPVSASEQVAAQRVARGQGQRATLVVVSRSMALDPSARMFGGPERVVVVTSRCAPAAAVAPVAAVAEVLRTGREQVDLAEALTVLADRGLRQVLCEGGPSLLGDLVAADLVDEVCLTVAPLLLAGCAPRIAHGARPPVPSSLDLDGAVLAEDGSLLTRWRRRQT